MQPLPPNFELEEHPDYVLKKGDLYGYGDDIWQAIDGLAGSRIKQLIQHGLHVAKKIEMNTPNLNIPAGYELVNDNNYIITKYDKYSWTEYGNDFSFCQSSVGKTYRVAKLQFGNLIVIRKIPENKEEILNKNEFILPAGYSIITDDYYVIKNGDKFCRITNGIFHDFSDSIGQTYNKIKGYYSKENDYICLSKDGADEKPKEEIKPQAGYQLVKDYQDYILQDGDRCFNSQWFPIHGWRGRTPKELNRLEHADIKAVAVKGMAEPRFKCSHPFPHGY